MDFGGLGYIGNNVFEPEKNQGLNSDADLVRRIMGGDRAASLSLYNRYMGPLYNYIYYRAKKCHHDAEEITQEVFLDVWMNMKVYDKSQNFWFWLCGIARRKCAKYFRSKGHSMETLFAGHSAHKQKLVDLLEGPSPQPADILVQREFGDLLALAISALMPTYQTLLILKYQEGKSLREIASIQDLSVEAVSSGLQRARAGLREILRRQKGATNE